MARTPNNICSLKDCEETFYTRPVNKEKFDNHFCCQEHYDKFRAKEKYTCPQCDEKFDYVRKEQIYCSKECTGLASRGDWDTVNKNKPKNSTEYKKEKLFSKGVEYVCSVKGCKYDTTLDVHRHIAGCDGGKYVFGNMFFICPNHHAEVTRGIIDLKKINNYILEER